MGLGVGAGLVEGLVRWLMGGWDLGLSELVVAWLGAGLSRISGVMGFSEDGWVCSCVDLGFFLSAGLLMSLCCPVLSLSARFLFFDVGVM